MFIDKIELIDENYKCESNDVINWTLAFALFKYNN